MGAAALEFQYGRVGKPMTEADPKGNLIEFKKAPRTPNLLPVRPAYDSCKHQRVYVKEGCREVTCRDCKAKLDAFTVLLEMAHKERRWLEDLDAWDARRESMLGERYDEQWERDHDGVLTPPEDPQLRRIWDTFHQAIGEKFCRMYSRKRRKRNGPEWYGVSTDGMGLSYEYARSCLVRKAQAK